METLITSTGGTFHHSEVANPLGEKVKARWGVLGDKKTVVMEMAEASGLELVPKEKRNPRFTSTYGTGEMIRAALDAGYRKFIIGIGDSATNDGGTGMIQALAHYGKMAEKITGIKAVEVPGSGAAGGLGAAFLFFTPAKLQTGIEIILDALLFDQKLAGADWILTGEGKTDFQTANGKGPVGIALRAAKKNVPVLCLSGGLGEGYQQVLEKGIHGIQSIVVHPEVSLEICMKEGRRLVVDASEQMARLIQVGQKIK